MLLVCLLCGAHEALAIKARSWEILTAVLAAAVTWIGSHELGKFQVLDAMERSKEHICFNLFVKEKGLGYEERNKQFCARCNGGFFVTEKICQERGSGARPTVCNDIFKADKTHGSLRAGRT